ncbi:hypothetical protein BZB76_6133 [Actinomadura pelletieri DSM 43383]|uniref:Uncharacterized protein n=1 Tax=Actinomadura pelletieri DSM 43383 TaxID=1120940 RepID=A0A495QBW2_9ACTN|nr:hypothetical protein [Actinomadura pelletieri]RKS68994.1 hypothetical protein BZB76_6133 [Actinomadura pelletieri DSM 43383]
MLDSVIRTLVPLVAGLLLTQAAKLGLDISEGTVTELVTVLATAAYYILGRLTEARLPRLGGALLSLGLTRRVPNYTRRGGAS